MPVPNWYPDASTVTETVKIEDEYGHEVNGYMEVVEHLVETEETETITE